MPSPEQWAEAHARHRKHKEHRDRRLQMEEKRKQEIMDRVERSKPIWEKQQSKL